MDISHYCYDITKKCFSKYVSVNQNYKALIYYCINGHMYWVSDKEEADKLVKRARNADVKIKSNEFVSYKFFHNFSPELKGIKFKTTGWKQQQM